METEEVVVENTDIEADKTSEDISEETKKELKDTFIIKNKEDQKKFDKGMEDLFKKKDPTQEEIVNHFKWTEKYKDMNYKQIMEKLKKENKPMEERLQKM